MSVTLPNADDDSKVPYRRHPIAVTGYQRMGAVGILAPDDRVELIEGEIIDMAPIGSLHASRVNKLVDLLTEMLRGHALVAAQNPIVLGEYSSPLPDIAVLRRREDYYAPAHPGPDDILFLIEVADTTTAYDRNVKVPLYARFGVREVWLLDLQQNHLEVHHGPDQVGYRHVDHYRTGRVSPQSFPDLRIEVDGLIS